MTEKEFQSIVVFLGSTPEWVYQCARGLSVEQLTWKPSPEEFSILEHVCHLDDIEREGYHPRIRRILSEDRPFLPDVDGSRLARERDYNSQDLLEKHQSFARARRDNLRLVEELPAEAVDRRGVLEGVGDITLGELLGRLFEHDQEHLASLQELRNQLRQRGEPGGPRAA